ncbi:MAG: hypothetical protein U0270_13605 [Labilithrix sp.]
MNRALSLLSAVALAALTAACDKTEPTGTPPATSSAAPLASAPLVAAPKPEPSASAPASASAAPATSGSAAAADCGGKENPCPLQGWMRENVNPPMNKKDMPALAAALDKIAAMAPAGYTNWASISKDGAAAARSGDENATKASCRSCHDQYKQKYKTEMRGRKVPGV